MNAHGAILDSFISLLSGISVNVYKLDVPEDESGNYVQVRLESGTGMNNKRQIADEVIVITDITTIFENNVDGSLCEGIDTEIFDRVLPTSTGHGLRTTAAMKIISVYRQSFTYIEENDGTKNYYRKVSRYSIKLFKTT